MRQRMPVALSAVSATAALLAATVLPAAPALAAPPITCGMTVTTNTTLTRNLTCPGPGLIIGADNITINLAGHTLAGSGPTTSTHTGIQAEGRANLRIQNGTITRFRQAIRLFQVRDVLLSGMRITGNTPLMPDDFEATLSLDEVQNIQIRDTQLAQPVRTRTLDALNTRGIRMERVQAIGRLDWSGGSGLVVTRSVFTDVSIGLLTDVSRVDIRQNVLRRASVYLSQANNVTIADNQIHSAASTTAIVLDQAAEPVIERNVISGARSGVSVGVPVVEQARIVRNTFVRNDYGVVWEEEDLIGQDLLVADNLFIGNRQAGIFIEAENVPPAGGPATITRNTFIRNGHESTDRDAAGRRINDGIHTNIPTGSPLTISHNRTYLNADHGIEALPTGSVIDGGGNQSTGDPNGCAGITCT